MAERARSSTFAKGFTKRDFVLLTDDDYPQTVIFECVKDRCSLLDCVTDGDRVSATFRLRGRVWQERFFVNLEAVAIERISAETRQEPHKGNAVSMEDDTEPPF